MKKMTIVVVFITVIAKVFGLLRDLVFTSQFGATAVTDAFNLALSVPNSVLAIVGAALVTGIVPMITRISSQGEERVNRFTSNVLNIFLAVCALMMVVILVVPELIVMIFGSGFTPQATAYASAYLRIIALGVFSIAVVQLGSGYLNVKRSFIIPAAITIPANICIVIAIFVSSKTGNPMILGYGQLIAMIIQALIIFFFMKRVGFQYRAVIDFKDEDLRMMITLALPLLLASVLSQFNDVIMKSYATRLHPTDGAYTYMGMATKLTGFVSGIFITAVLNVSYPSITQNVVSGNIKKVNKSINEAILTMSLFVIPAVVGFTTLARGIVELVYYRNAITAADIDIVVPIFICDALVLLALMIRELFFRVHYAYHDMKSPVKNSVYVTLMFIAGIIIFPPVFTWLFGQPLAGLAFAYSIAALLGCYPLYRSAKRLLGRMYLKYIAKDMIKIVLSALVMGLVVLLVKGPMLNILSSNMATIATIGLGVVSYLIALIALRTNFVLSLLTSILFRK